ncbi:hypothetical protein BGZ60DRAFT_8361 [Tricladium varicosporioides]|nr:hypothetical protein BGZ60DRAFT_8361 [Hymenoscyphus varicosporioides]
MVTSMPRTAAADAEASVQQWWWWRGISSLRIGQRFASSRSLVTKSQTRLPSFSPKQDELGIAASDIWRCNTVVHEIPSLWATTAGKPMYLDRNHRQDRAETFPSTHRNPEQSSTKLLGMTLRATSVWVECQVVSSQVCTSSSDGELPFGYIIRLTFEELTMWTADGSVASYQVGSIRFADEENAHSTSFTSHGPATSLSGQLFKDDLHQMLPRRRIDQHQYNRLTNIYFVIPC